MGGSGYILYYAGDLVSVTLIVKGLEAFCLQRWYC